ncbi:TonB-dependent hemoglobin/transferrin/lactoferrin family receptor [Vibrio hippocampi]|uniref:Vitamin B12 transporter BtuB n=1 Tax=Vibrio hippocampi TaxID=654686 RepID=A0ABM8ZMW1_9VIBR|nr:TonB-dependent hemoglobin/transferrin/lactoferrin family receptor [Vibrio hippocampi]CAH0529633.1 Vitamin B12 transporter BtuB [Vibrio hippocampi]
MRNKTILASSIVLALSQGAHAEEAYTFDEVVVSATRTEQNKTDVSSSIESVDSEQIDSSLSTDLKDALKTTPGVDATTSGRFGISGFNIRGMDGDRVKVVVDGVQQVTPFNPGGGATQAIYPNAIELDTLTSIEVNKSASSTLYGSNALGGVVVLKTKDPEDFLVTDGDENRFGLKSSYSSKDEQFKNTLTWAMRQGDLETILIGTYAQGSETENYGGNNIEGDDRTSVDPADKELNNVLAKAYYNLNDANRVGIVFERYDYEYDENRLSGNEFNDYGPYGHFGYEDSTSNDSNVRTRYGINHEWKANNVIFDNLFWQVNYQTTETTNENYANVSIYDAAGYFGYTPGFTYDGGRNRIRQAEEKTWQIDSQFDKLLEFGNDYHELTYGFSYLHTDFSLYNRDIFFEDSSLNGPGSTTVPDAELIQWGVFAQDNMFLLDESLVINLGLRYDSFKATPSADAGFETEFDENSNDALTGQVGAVYHFNENLSTFAQISQGFKAPTVKQLYFEYDTGSEYIPNPDLEAEKSTSYEIGLRGQNDFTQFELVGYFNKYKDFIATVDLGENAATGKDQVTVVNLDKVEIKGIEYSQTLLLDRLSFVPQGIYSTVSLAYSEGEDKSTGQSLDSIAPLTGVFGFGYDNIAHRFGGLATLKVVDRKTDWYSDDNIETAGYGVFDVTAYYQPATDLTLRAGVFNLFDKKYFDYQDLSGYDSSDNYQRLSQPGRNWGVSLDYQF